MNFIKEKSPLIRYLLNEVNWIQGNAKIRVIILSASSLMKDEAFIIVDDLMRVEAYHPHLLDLFSTSSHEHPIQSPQQVIEDYPELWQKIRQFLMAENGKMVDTFFLTTHPSDHMPPIQVTLFHSITNLKTRKILIYFSKNHHQWKYQVPLWRSLKYNAISTLAPSIAHEIRNPLSSLAIHTEILDNTLPALTLPGEQYQRIKKSIAVLQSELERVMKIIDRFFRLARPGVKESSYEDLNSILLEAFELVRPQCFEQGIKIELQTEKNIPFVYLNRDELLQVLLNILINAMESVSEGGIICMRSEKRDKSSVIRIQDNGPGIPAEDLRKIFSENFSHKNSGSGMSLILAKQIIENIAGKISVQSDPKTGTHFTIELPFVSQFEG